VCSSDLSITPMQQVMARIISLALPKMGVTTIEASAISQDKAVVDAYVNDPLVYRGKVRARLGVELLKTIQKLPERMSALHLPVLIMHGTDDRLCNPEGSHLIHKKVSSKDKTLKLYEGFHHEIFNEPGRNQVMADMASWLEAHL
jgi:acylglycerol lipase